MRSTRDRIDWRLVLGLAVACAAAQTVQAVQLKVACVQMRQSNTMAVNVSNIVAHIASEAALGTRVVVFCEFSLTGYDATVAPTIPQSAITSALDQVSLACATHHVYAIVGTPWYEEGIRYNAGIVIGPDGSIVERYYKMHVVEDYCTNGNRLAMFNIDGVPATLFICHDERYPELMRIPVLGGAKIGFYISFESDEGSGKNFNYRCQIVGRAVENQAWVVACNAPTGNECGDSHGQSRIIGPDGTVHQEAGADETVIRDTIETDQASNAWAQAGASVPLYDQFWQEGLRVLQTQNPDFFSSVTAHPFLQPNVGALGDSPSPDLQIACVQMQMSGNISANVAKIQSFVQSEATAGTRVVVFPECALTDRNPANLPVVVQSQIDAAIGQIASTCQARNVYAIVGSPFRDNDGLHDGAYVIGPAGTVIKRCAQVHTDLPGVFVDGGKPSLFKIDGVYVGAMVGHDIHFPELSRTAVLAGARACFYLAYEPANTNLYASESQVVCRSVESQTFTVFCNAGTGNAAGNSTGHSRIVKPTATILAEADGVGDRVIRAIVPTSQAYYDYARAGAGTATLSAFWQEGLDIVRIDNPEFYGDVWPAPSIVAVSPDPAWVFAGRPYTQQLTIAPMSLPMPTWSILQGPDGAQVDSSGLVNGWTPTLAQVGNTYTLQVRAENRNGSSTETWQVRVKSRADLDGDGDVDQSDFGLLQICLSGSGSPYGPGCADADLTDDGYVEDHDLSTFLNCMAGPSQLPGC